MEVTSFVCALVGLGFTALVGVTAWAAEPSRPVIDRSLLEPIDPLVIAMKRSNDRAVAALMTRDVMIIDEDAPHRWTGPNAEERWSNDDKLLIRKRGVPLLTVLAASALRSSQRDARVPDLAARVRLHAPRKAPARDRIVDDHHVRTRDGWRISLLRFAKTGDTSDATWDG